MKLLNSLFLFIAISSFISAQSKDLALDYERATKLTNANEALEIYQEIINSNEDSDYVWLSKLKKAEMLYAIGSYRNESNKDSLNSLDSKNFQDIELDVTDEKTFPKMSKNINRSIDYLICNAGINNGYGSFNSEDHSPKEMLNVFNVNVIGPILTIRNLIDFMSNNGKIIIISSIMCVQAHEGSRATVYRASKAAVNNLIV